MADGSLTRFVITAEPEGAAHLRSVLSCPLAAPAPDADGPDPRTAAQRRYDALMTVIGRGVAGTTGHPSPQPPARGAGPLGRPPPAVACRDRGCSYPGCTVPATWCEAHHVAPWSRGSPSDLANDALLCRRHHTRVHDRDLTATITTTGLRWHLR